jgi:eukaryotic-like serine/threonine-protein kinase
VNREGKEEIVKAPPDAYQHPRISPDGRLLALTVESSGNTDIWIWDLARKTKSRLTFDEAGDSYPVWTSNGRRIAFCSSGKENTSACCKAADDTGNVELLGSASSGVFFPASWSSDGKILLLEDMATGEGSIDIVTLSLEGDRVKKPFLAGNFIEANPQVSPDGRYRAYFSQESGQSESYVRPFPDVNKGRWQISTSGGQEPRWSRDGRELFYRNGDAMMAVAVETKPAFKAGVPAVVF